MSQTKFKRLKESPQRYKEKKTPKEIEKKAVQSPSQEINMERIKKDNSDNKEISQLKIKLKCLENPKYFNSKTFTRNDLMKLCDAYKIYSQKYENR